MSDLWGINTNLDDFERLLRKEDLQDAPVPIERFVVDKHYLGLPPLSDVQLEIVRHNTQVLKPHTLVQLMGEEKGMEYYTKYTVNEVIAQLGKGSGKDHVSRISMAYIVYLMHCLRDPLDYYNKAGNIHIALINLAVNAKQAQQVFFEPFKNLLLNSPYFNEHPFDPRVQELYFFERPVRCFSGHSESEGWEGYDVMMCVLDEISAFKCLSKNLPVLTPKGWIKNGDLNVGDFVIGQNGKDTEVLAIYDAGEKDVYRVSFEDGSYIDCSNDHIWNVYEYSDGRRVVNKNLELKDFKSLRLPSGNRQYRYSIPTVEPVEFDGVKDLPIDPYVLGILLSEGSLSGACVRFSTNDDFVVQRVQQGLPDGYEVINDNECNWRIRSNNPSGNGVVKNILKKSLDDLGLWGSTSHGKFIPSIYLYASIEDRKLLLAGLMDGDGTTARGHGSYTTVSTQLKDDIVELCRSLGGIPTASLQNSWYRNDKNQKIDCADRWMICPRVPFNPFLLPRKNEKWTAHRRSMRKTIVNIEPLGFAEEMMCIKIANEDGLYVIDNYTVTHNTDSELQDSIRQRGSASQIYNMAKASVISRFPDIGKVILLSFPRFKGDFIQERYNEYIEKELPKTWGLKAATWEVNPTITREDLEPEFIRNPVEAASRFACEPPEMEDAYFRDVDAVRRAFSYGEPPIDENGHWKPWFNGSDNFTRFIHVDLGLKRDAAALSMVHISGMKEVKTTAGIETLPIVYVDLVYRWAAPVRGEIDFASVRSLIVELARKFDVAGVTFDMWQSVDMIQSLKLQGINADWHTVKKTDYDTLGTAIYDGRLRGYWDEHLVNQELLKLRLITNTKVDHPNQGSKDAADAVAGATFRCLQNATLGHELEIEIWRGGIELEEDEEIHEKITPKSADYTPVKESEPEGIREWLLDML